jgi:MerR family transcriptional regulator, mercuric resistance operon regulatory protein
MVVLDRHGPKMHPVATTGSRSILVPAITDARAKAFPIGELSKHSGVKIETIRYYERAKMLAPPPRTASGRRVYGSMDLRILVFIRRSRELGFSLGQIRTLLRLGGPERATCREVREIATHHLDDIRAKIEDLKKLERLLSKTVARCTGKTAPECPVLDVLDIERQK